MYKIYNKYNDVKKCKNLVEVERAILDFYNKDEIKITNIESMAGVDIMYSRYNNDAYGNPLYMVIFYNTNKRKVTTFKSYQSYNIEEDIKRYLSKKVEE